MEFRLLYKGPLNSNGNQEHKHSIRRQFHPQLKSLWNQHPLSNALPVPLSQGIDSVESAMRVLGSNATFFHRVNNYAFLPLVREMHHLVAGLDILLLRQETPGRIIGTGGDIDNRLKTLFDALRMPRESNELKSIQGPATDESPIFYCLLEDDSLITDVSVKTDRLLDQGHPSDVMAVIHVRIKATEETWFNKKFVF